MNTQPPNEETYEENPVGGIDVGLVAEAVLVIGSSIIERFPSQGGQKGR